MRNHVQPGRVLTAIAPAGGVVSGDPVLLGAFFGVATTTAAEGEEFELFLGEVFELPKVAAQAWSFGVKLYFDGAAKLITTVASGNTLVGAAAAAAANPSAVGRVRLNGVSV